MPSFISLYARRTYVWNVFFIKNSLSVGLNEWMIYSLFLLHWSSFHFEMSIENAFLCRREINYWIYILVRPDINQFDHRSFESILCYLLFGITFCDYKITQSQYVFKMELCIKPKEQTWRKHRIVSFAVISLDSMKIILI